MNKGSIGVSQKQNLSTIQTQKMSMHQIQTLNFLAMSANDLREEILNAVNENPALQIVKDPFKEQFKNQEGHRYSKEEALQSAQDYQSMLEQTQDYGETLQEHLLNQLNLQKINQDEYELCQSLIYNLDKNGFYGSMLDPVVFLNKARPNQTPSLLKKCIDRIQQMDPVGTCCKNAEESLYIQAVHKKNSPKIALFLLEKPEHLELLNPPVKEIVYKKLKNKINELHQQSFAKPLIIDDEQISIEKVQEAISFIQKLNPFPAANFRYDSSAAANNIPNVVLKIEEIQQKTAADDQSNGIIYGDEKTSFQIKYASGIVPEIRIDPDFENFGSNQKNRQLLAKARELVQSLEYCKNTIALQGYAIATFQRQFLLKGPDYLVPLTHKQVAQACNIHESTVSRMCSKKNGKYIQCKWGVFPASYFFSTALPTENGGTLSSQYVKQQIASLIQNSASSLSDNKITQLLNEKGIKIARRTVAKYRSQMNLENSYNRR